MQKHSDKERSMFIMKMKKLVSGLISAFTAVTVFAAAVGAYDINKDFKTGWSVNTSIPATEFADVTADSVITFTYSADASLAEKAGHEYWVIKPMINDAGWPFIADINGLQLSESGDSYVLDTEKTKVSFSFSAESVETLKTAGMALMGHGITLETMTISEGDLASILAAEPNYSEKTEEEAAPEAEEAAEPEAEEAAPEAEEAEEEAETAEPAETEAASDVPASDGNTTTPVTGNGSAAGIVSVMILASAAAVVSRKR